MESLNKLSSYLLILLYKFLPSPSPQAFSLSQQTKIWECMLALATCSFFFRLTLFLFLFLLKPNYGVAWGGGGEGGIKLSNCVAVGNSSSTKVRLQCI